MTSSLGHKRAAVDRSVHRAIVGLEPSHADAVLAGLSRSANHGVLWFGVAGALAMIGPAPRRAAARGVVSLGIASAAANLVGKSLVGGARPELASVPVARRLRITPTSGSFPSGHTASAVAFATGVALEQPVAGALLAPLAGAVAYSRIHVGAHWFSDVLGGVVIGLGAAVVTVAVRRPARAGRRAGRTSEAAATSPEPTAELPAHPVGTGLGPFPGGSR